MAATALPNNRAEGRRSYRQGINPCRSGLMAATALQTIAPKGRHPTAFSEKAYESVYRY